MTTNMDFTFDDVEIKIEDAEGVESIQPTSSVSAIPQSQTQSSTCHPLSHISKDLLLMRQRNVLCDVTLMSSNISCDSVLINAHSVILAASSSFFYNLFVLNGPLIPQQTYQITDIDAKTLEAVVNFLYGVIPEDLHTLELLRNGATVLGIAHAEQYVNRSTTSACNSTQKKRKRSIEVDINADNDSDYVPDAEDYDDDDHDDEHDVLVGSSDVCGNMKPKTPVEPVTKLLEVAKAKDCKSLSAGYEGVTMKTTSNKTEIITNTCFMCNKHFGAYDAFVSHLWSEHSIRMSESLRNRASNHRPVAKKASNKRKRSSEYTAVIEVQSFTGSVISTNDDDPFNYKKNGLDPDECHVCHMYMYGKFVLGQHLWSKHRLQNNYMENKPDSNGHYQCLLCSHLCVTRETYIDHKARKHHKAERCKLCVKKYSRQISYLIHLHKDHPTGPYYVCCICGLGYNKQHFVVNHFKIVHNVTATFPQLRGLKAVITPLNIESIAPLYEAITDARTVDLTTWGMAWLKSSYYCPDCHQVFNTDKQLADDIRSHLAEKSATLASLDQKLFECHQCGETFSCYKDALKHTKDHEQCCLNCNKRYVNVEDLETHQCKVNKKSKHLSKLSTDKQGEPLKLNSIQFSIMTVDDSDPFNYKREGLDPNQCHVCHVYYYTTGLLAQHLWLKHKVSTKWMKNEIDSNGCYQCLLCPKMYDSVDAYTAHRKRAHKIGDNCAIKAQCQACNDNELPVKRLAHLFEDHADEYLYICCICGVRKEGPHVICKHFQKEHNITASYPQLRGLKAVITPLNIKAITPLYKAVFDSKTGLTKWGSDWLSKGFYCPDCNRMFSTKEELLYDLEIHLTAKRSMLELLNQDTYECHQCGKTFLYSQQARIHKNNVHEQRYPCEFCRKRCYNQEALVNHTNNEHKMMIACDLCGRFFRTAKALDLHNSNKHFKRITASSNDTAIIPGKIGSLEDNTQVISDDASKQEPSEPTNNTTHPSYNFSIVTVDENDPFNYRRNGSDPDQCHVCLKYYYFAYSLGQHLWKQHKISSKYMLSEANAHGDYQCLLCPKLFHARKPYLAHNKIRHQPPPKTCVECTDLKNQSIHYVVHLLEKHANEHIYICCICGVRYNKNRHITYHFKVDHNINASYQQLRGLRVVITPINIKFIKPLYEAVKNGKDGITEWGYAWIAKQYYCPDCDQVFSNEIALSADIRAHISDKKEALSLLDQSMYDCHVCGETFKTYARMYIHISRIHEQRHTCVLCNKRCASKEDRDAHSLDAHGDGKIFKCKICPSRFKSTSEVKEHVALHHKAHTIRFTCDICGKGYVLKRQLRAHKRTHTQQIRRHVCHICGFKALFPTTLKQHMASHSNNRSFLCTVCGAGFKVKGKLYLHMKLHENKIYTCNICGHHSKTKHYLALHQQMHSTDRNHECELCGNTYKRRKALVLHIKTSHKEAWPLMRRTKKPIIIDEVNSATQGIPT